MIFSSGKYYWIISLFPLLQPFSSAYFWIFLLLEYWTFRPTVYFFFFLSYILFCSALLLFWGQKHSKTAVEFFSSTFTLLILKIFAFISDFSLLTVEHLFLFVHTALPVCLWQMIALYFYFLFYFFHFSILFHSSIKYKFNSIKNK